MYFSDFNFTYFTDLDHLFLNILKCYFLRNNILNNIPWNIKI